MQGDARAAHGFRPVVAVRIMGGSSVIRRGGVYKDGGHVPVDFQCNTLTCMSWRRASGLWLVVRKHVCGDRGVCGEEGKWCNVVGGSRVFVLVLTFAATTPAASTALPALAGFRG